MSQRTTDMKSAAERLARSRGGAAQPSSPPADDSQPELRAVSAAPGPNPEAKFNKRLDKLEKQNFRMKLAVVVLVMVVGYLSFDQFVPENILIKRTLVESRELKLLDNDGNARLFLRMYSRVPVLQLLDSKGKPRLSLGLRFDDTPFIDLSDKTGRARVTLELTPKDEPSLKLMDANGEPTFKIN